MTTAKEETTRGRNKDKQDYYLDKVCQMMSDRCTLQNFRRCQIAEAYDYYYGKHVNNDYKNLLSVFEKKGSGEAPYNYINFDSISSKVNVLVGELSGRDFGITVSADNTDSHKRRKAREQRLRTLMQMNSMMVKAAQESGMAIGLNENIPKNEKELQKVMDSYKDVYEAMIEEAIKEFIDDEMYLYRRSKNFLDLIVANKCHAQVKLVNGYLKYDMLNPLNVLEDPFSNDDYQLDASGVVIAKYMTVPAVIEEYGIDHEIIKEAISRYRNTGVGNKKAWRGSSVQMGDQSISAFTPFLGLSNDYETCERILVIYAEWFDTKEKALKITHDPHGGSHVHIYKDNLKSAKLTNKEKLNDKNRLEFKKYQIKRHATIIGGSYVLSAGETGNYERDPKYPERTKLSVITYVHNYNGQQSVSIVDRIKSIQDFKNFLLTSLQKDIAKGKGSGVAIDLAYVDPKVYGVGEDAVKELLSKYTSYGVYLYNSKLGGVPEPGAKPMQFLEQRMQGQITETLTLVNWLDQEMNKITGLNENRMGLAPERQLVQTGRMSLSQSNAITDPYYRGFEGFEKMLFSRIARIIAMSWVYRPERYDRIANKLDLDIPKDHKADLQSYKVNIETLPIGRDLLMQMVQASMERGGIEFPEAVKLLLNTNENFREALIKYVNNYDEKQEALAEQQERMLQADAQNKARAEQMRAQREITVQDAKNQGAVQVAEINNSQQYSSSKLRVDQADRSDILKTSR